MAGGRWEGKVETMIREEGEAATLEVGVHGIHPELVRLLGRMKFTEIEEALKKKGYLAELLPYEQ